MLILGYFGHFPLYTQIPQFWHILETGVFWHSGISWNPGIWHFLESGILILPGWCYISSEYMIYRKCLYSVYLYCLKSLHICYIILFYFIVFYYPEISHILHYRVILLCICCLLVGLAVFSFLFIIVFTCRVVITACFDWWWSGIACCRSLQLPFCGWGDGRSFLQVSFCGGSSSCWGLLVRWGLLVCLLGWGMASGHLVIWSSMGWVSLSIKEKGCPLYKDSH